MSSGREFVRRRRRSRQIALVPEGQFEFIGGRDKKKKGRILYGFQNDHGPPSHFLTPPLSRHLP